MSVHENQVRVTACVRTIVVLVHKDCEHPKLANGDRATEKRAPLGLTTVRSNSIRVVGTDEGDVTKAPIAKLQSPEVRRQL